MSTNQRTVMWIAPAVCALLLAGIWVERQLYHLPVGDPASYHALVSSVADRLPYRIGDWVGTDIKPDAAAVEMLKANVLKGRRYENAVTGEAATLLIVQCTDARDMSGHYPPICYPAQGWTEREASQRDVAVRDSSIPVTVYRFTQESLARFDEIQIYNFFVRPDGSVESGARGVRAAAGDPRMKGFGAGQVQVRFDAPMTQARRDEIFDLLVTNALPILDAIREGNV